MSRRRVARIRRRSVSAHLMPDVASAGAAEDGIENLLERFLVSIIALAGAQAGAVRVLSDDGQHLRLVAQIGLPAQLLTTESSVEHDCGICGVAAGQYRQARDGAPCGNCHQPHGAGARVPDRGRRAGPGGIQGRRRRIAARRPSRNGHHAGAGGTRGGTRVRLELPLAAARGRNHA